MRATLGVCAHVCVRKMLRVRVPWTCEPEPRSVAVTASAAPRVSVQLYRHLLSGRHCHGAPCSVIHGWRVAIFELQSGCQDETWRDPRAEAASITIPVREGTLIQA